MPYACVPILTEIDKLNIVSSNRACEEVFAQATGKPE